MANWFAHGRTTLKVGFGQQGSECEGGSCKHLKEGDVATGYTSENDSFGSEVYLYCSNCYDQFLERRKAEPVVCNDCSATVPRNTAKFHIPYYVDEQPAAKWLSIVCKDCQTKPRHLKRLEIDEEERSHDQNAQDDWFDEHGPDDRDDEDDWVMTPGEKMYVQPAVILFPTVTPKQTKRGITQVRVKLNVVK